MDEFIIVVDSREQLPYRWPDNLTVVKGLSAGDYSVLGMENRVAVERKSLIDAYGTFGSNRERFEAELERLSKFDYAAVVIEASMFDALKNPPKGKRHRHKHFVVD